MLNLPHVAARVFGTPLMIGRAKLEVILGVLGPRFSGGLVESLPSEPDPSPLASVTPEGIAVIPITGTLVSRSGFVDAASGLLSYGEIGEAVANTMAAPDVRGVILDMDSPGGEVGGLFDLVDRITTAKKDHNKPLWAVADECALSAAYAIASTADRIYVTRTGEIGSIGVVAAHVDESGADAKAGLAWSFIFAGDRKVDGNSHGALSERARADIQADVDRLYGDFCTLVATNRSLLPDAVRATEAAIFRGDLAIKAGLADRLGTLDVALAEMTAEFEQPLAAWRLSTNPKPKRSASMATENTEQIETEPPGPVVTPIAPITEPPRQPDAAETLRAEYAEIADIAAQAGRLGVTIDAADAMRKGIKPDALRRTALDSLARHSEAASVVAAAPSMPIAGDSPIVRRARERAAQSQK